MRKSFGQPKFGKILEDVPQNFSRDKHETFIRSTNLVPVEICQKQVKHFLHCCLARLQYIHLIQMSMFCRARGVAQRDHRRTRHLLVSTFGPRPESGMDRVARISLGRISLDRISRSYLSIVPLSRADSITSRTEPAVFALEASPGSWSRTDRRVLLPYTRLPRAAILAIEIPAAHLAILPRMR